MKKLIFTTIAFGYFLIPILAQNLSVDQYIQLHKDLAIREMKRMGIPAAITLAQGLLETENGNSDLVKKSNNHFGLKCKSSWNAGSVSHDDDASGECFRTYKDAEASYRDHSNYLRGNDRYSFLFKLDPRDYRGWAFGLKKAGYATNPRYPNILIKNIEDNNLQQYTLGAIGQVPVYDASKYQSDPEEVAIAQLTKNANTSEPEVDLKLTVNGIKAILAHRSRSLLAIATDNNINLSKLLEFNDLQEDGLLKKDQYLFLEKKVKEGNKDFHIVQNGETLYDIAQRNGVCLENLAEYNQINSGQSLIPGQKIYLKNVKYKEQATEVKNIGKSNISADKPPNINGIKLYQVQPKEGLYSISKKWGVTIAQIKEWNNLVSDNVYIGQQLIVSK